MDKICPWQNAIIQMDHSSRPKGLYGQAIDTTFRMPVYPMLKMKLKVKKRQCWRKCMIVNEF